LRSRGGGCRQGVRVGRRRGLLRDRDGDCDDHEGERRDGEGRRERPPGSHRKGLPSTSGGIAIPICWSTVGITPTMFTSSRVSFRLTNRIPFTSSGSSEQ